MKGSEKSNESPAWVDTLITGLATLIGAVFGLGIGIIFVVSGAAAGLFVLLLTVLGAVVGRFYVAGDATWPWSERG